MTGERSHAPTISQVEALARESAALAAQTLAYSRALIAYAEWLERQVARLEESMRAVNRLAEIFDYDE